MKKIFLLIILLQCLFLNAKTFTVASYNVENLFDLKFDGTEYKRYIPNTKYWNKESFLNKLNNISKTINHLDASIIALQEIESKRALESLKKQTQYKYSVFIKNKKASVGLAILSKYPIAKHKRIIVDKNDKYSRDILKATIYIQNKPLIIYVNHWRSKRAKESKRIIYASALQKDIKKLTKNTDYIVLGDLNSNYDEYQTFKYEKKLNDTYGITGINQILNTTIDENFVTKENILKYNKLVHYNLWLELKEKNRFSSKFKNYNNTPDNILLSRGLFDKYNLSYIDNSFKVFKPSYLYKYNKIKRWNQYKKNGYSDHLPIYAQFSTNKQKKNKIIDILTKKNNISYLYKIEQVKNYKLKDVTVIYQRDNIAIIKHSNDIKSKAILIYKPSKELKLGFTYDIIVNKIEKYNGLKEIKELSKIKKLRYIKNYKDSYLDAKNIDLHERKYQNNIVKNLKGVYKKGYLYYSKNDKKEKIKVYFKKAIKKPEDGKKITISSGHISIYKSKVQIVLYSTNDFK